MAQPGSPQVHRFPVLDGLRGVAALGIVIYHFHVISHVATSPFVHGAYLFVDFFFVLSGFVISYTYGARLSAPRDVSGFVIRRFGRLWPLHFATLMFLFGLELLKLVATNHGWAHFDHAPFDPKGSNTWPSLLTNLFLLQALGIHGHLSWNEPAWSICTEFWTYLIFAALCCSGRRMRDIGAAALIAGGFAVLLSVARDMNIAHDFGLFRCIVGFFTGYFTLRLWRAMATQRHRWIKWLELPLLVAVVLFITYTGDSQASLLAPMVFALAVLVFAREDGAVSRLLQSRPIEKLGAWSYSIYMVHSAIFMLFSWGMMAAAKKFPSIHKVDFQGSPHFIVGHNLFWGDALIVPYAAAVLVVSALTYRFIEVPARDYFNGLASSRAKRSRSSATSLVSALADGVSAVNPVQGRHSTP